MNKVFRTFGVFLLTAVLLASLGLGTRSSIESLPHGTPTSDGSESYSSSSKHLCYFIDFNDTVQSFESWPETHSPDPLDFVASHKFAEKTFAAAYRSYKIYSHNLLARFRKCDIIFPFHYFW